MGLAFSPAFVTSPASRSLSLNFLSNRHVFQTRRDIEGLRIALVDDHARVRDALAAVLARERDFEVVAAGSSGDEAIAIAEDLLPDVILLDINMPGDGIVAARRIFRVCPAIKIVMLTSADDAYLVDAALSAGARGYIVKGEPAAVIADTIRDIDSGQSYLAPSLAAKLLASPGYGAPWDGDTESPIELVEREEQILRRLAQGLTYTEIAESTGLSAAAVAAFVTNILMKLHAQTVVDEALKTV
jgi:two-component system, NarL family, nitrate/nitrite response regulator NarL